MEQLVNFIIRPPRAEYDPNHDLLDQEFMLKGKLFQRKDVEVKNSRGDVLQCSHYVPIITPDGKPLPCVIYCHGNSGCRADASEAAIILLPSNITVFTLDFSGSGLSGGDHVSLGWYEKEDLRAVVDYLRSDGNVSLIGLWGRSMGAVTSLMYGAEDPSIAGMVVDSPFSDLNDLMMELVDTYKYRLPKFTVKYFIQFMRKAIQKKAKFDIMDLNTIKVAKSCFVPVLVGHAIDDEFIRPHHSDRIFEAYVGDKNIIKFEGDHNSPRPQFYFDSINIFFHNVLQPPEDEVGGNYFGTMHDYFDKTSWDKPHEIGYADLNGLGPSPVAELATSSTEDANQQPRPKRPMSRIEVPSDVPYKDKQFEGLGEGDEKEPLPSSSQMISFELSNGHPYGPHVPASLDDDLYVEYPLDNMADFPSNADEEDRMFMEAVLMSLKDLETRHPHAGDQTPSDGTSVLRSSQEDDPDASSKNECPKTESTFNSISNDHDLASQQPSPDTSSSSAGPAFDTPPSLVESQSTTTSNRSDVSVGVPNSSEASIVDNTKATVTVVKNPTSHIMDGLMRRWDFNFFRNSR